MEQVSTTKFCIVPHSLRGEKVCGGHLMQLNEANLSVLKHQIKHLWGSEHLNSDYICRDHWNQHLKYVQKFCFDPKCEMKDKNNSLRKCPVRMVKCFDLHELALVQIHQQCWSAFDQRYSHHPSFLPLEKKVKKFSFERIQTIERHNKPYKGSRNSMSQSH